MIPTEKISPQMLSDRAFIVAAVSCNSIGLVKKHYSDWLDDEGYIPFYEMVLEVVDELMFTEGSEYLKYYHAENQDDWFTINHNTCLDWYFMSEAEKLFHRNLK